MIAVERKLGRKRMIFDLPSDVQLALRLAAVKRMLTTAGVLQQLVSTALPDELKQARTILAPREKQ